MEGVAGVRRDKGRLKEEMGGRYEEDLRKRRERDRRRGEVDEDEWIGQGLRYWRDLAGRTRERGGEVEGGVSDGSADEGVRRDRDGYGEDNGGEQEVGYWRELAGKAGEDRMCLGREGLRSQEDEGKGRDEDGKRRKGEDRVDEVKEKGGGEGSGKGIEGVGE